MSVLDLVYNWSLLYAESKHCKIFVEQSEDNLLSKLKALTATEARVLLSRYFDRVIELRDLDRKKDIFCAGLELKVSTFAY